MERTYSPFTRAAHDNPEEIMADINFTCPSCNQELTADSSMLGQEIACPACGAVIVIPEGGGAGGGGGRLVVPSTGPGAEGLIGKPNRPLEAAAKAAIKMLFKTLRHHEYVKEGKDGFDEAVAKFLDQAGEPNIVSVNPIQYTHTESEGKQPMIDYGVMIVYRG